MIIISQNAKNYAIPFPDDTIFRINLAWVNSLDELKDLLLKNNKYKIFLDLPVGRIKPPNNKYTLAEIIPIIKSAKNIVLIGGGYIGLEVASAMIELGLKVTILEAEARILKRVTSQQL